MPSSCSVHVASGVKEFAHFDAELYKLESAETSVRNSHSIQLSIVSSNFVEEKVKIGNFVMTIIQESKFSHKVVPESKRVDVRIRLGA